MSLDTNHWDGAKRHNKNANLFELLSGLVTLIWALMGLLTSLDSLRR